MNRNYLWILFFFSFFPVASSGAASDYSIPEIRVEAAITEAGTVRIQEHRTYRFNGSFSWADYRLPKRGFTEIRDIRISENGESYLNENSEKPGTFTVAENSDEVVVTWYYTAVDTSLTFTVSYELAGAVAVGPDWSEFFWNYIASGREKSTRHARISISLPEPVPADSLYLWSRGADPAATDILREDIDVTAENIDRQQSLQLRLLFPSTVFNPDLANVTHPDLTSGQIIEAEEEYRRREEQRRRRQAFFASVTRELTFLILLASLGLFLFLYRKYGKRHRTQPLSGSDTVVIPGQIPPAIIGFLMAHGQTTGRHLAATLFDLARRGWFVIREGKQEKVSWFGGESQKFVIEPSDPSPDKTPEAWETMLISFVKKRIEQGYNSFDELFKPEGSNVKQWFAQWKKEIKKEVDRNNWIDKNSHTGMWLNIAGQGMLIVIAILLTITGGNHFGIAGIIGTGIMLTFSAVIPRRTPKGEETYRRWKAYRSGLKHADKRTLRMEMLDRHFIYALAFHLTSGRIGKLIETESRDTHSLFPWIVLMPGSTHSPAELASSLTTMAASGTSAFSGTSGGSGASVGSAGGGASGGAG